MSVFIGRSNRATDSAMNDQRIDQPLVMPGQIRRQMYARSAVQREYSVDEDTANESVNESFASPSGSLAEQDRMRRKLRYFFMNPCDKYTAKRRLPFKLILQVAKIALVTFQLVMFGMDAERHAAFVQKNLVTFKNLYLNGWDPTLETMPYPPTRGPLAVYTYDKLYEAVNFLMVRYNTTLELALGSYDFASNPAPPVVFCRSYYEVGEIFANNQSFTFKDNVLHQCVNVTGVEGPPENRSFDFKAFLRNDLNLSMNFDSVIDISFHFSLKSVNLRSLDMDQQPDCYLFEITVKMDNSLHNGEVGISLDSRMTSLEPCRGRIDHQSVWGFTVRVLVTLYDCLVVLVSLLSIMLCVRSLHNATHVRLTAIRYFKTVFDHRLSRADRGAFIDGWLVLIVVSDALVIAGSFIKLLTDNSITDNFQTGGVALGVGVCLVWCGVLRYLGFFPKYNILLRVLSTAAPSVLRFFVCAGVLFSAFSLCGWVVIGPYHVKFRTIESTTACLFALLNGDDMYVTFRGVPKSRSLFAFYFNYVYLFVFITLFIYVVLNVFVTIIIDAYEVMKEGADENPDSFMWTFIKQRSNRSSSRQYRRDEQEEAGCNMARACSDLCHRLCCCRHHLQDDGESSDSDMSDSWTENVPTETTGLLSGQTNTPARV